MKGKSCIAAVVGIALIVSLAGCEWRGRGAEERRGPVVPVASAPASTFSKAVNPPKGRTL